MVDPMKVSYAAPSDSVGMFSHSNVGRDSRDPGRNAEAVVAQPTELLHACVYLLGALHMWIWNQFRVVESNERSQGGRSLVVFDACTDDLGGPAEEESERGRGLVTADGPTVGAKPLFDTIVVEDGRSDGCLANPASANQNDRCACSKKILGGKGGDSLGTLDANVRRWIP